MRHVAAAIAVGLVFFSLQTARAGEDYRCLAACQQAGYRHDYCLPRCTVQNPGQSAVPMSSKHGTDYRCVDRCTGTGRPRPYCLKNCSY